MFFGFSGRLDFTNDKTAGCRAGTLGKKILFTKFKLAAIVCQKNTFSAISQLLVDIETSFWWQNACFSSRRYYKLHSKLLYVNLLVNVKQI